MADFPTVLASLATAFGSIAGLRVQEGGLWPDSFQPPALGIVLARRRPSNVDQSEHYYTFSLVLAVQAGTLAAGQKNLNEYISTTGPKSIEAALKGSAIGAQVNACDLTEYGVINIGGTLFVGAIWSAEVMA